jgi:ABC-type ATPase with predicted acetyltransferase domain
MHPFRTILPGHFEIERGSARDYVQLARFHYARTKPASFAQIWRCDYVDPVAHQRQLAAVIVMSFPTRAAAGRRSVLPIHGGAGEELRFINQHVRSISRVIVHPQFRSLGLSIRMIKWLCKCCNTRYVEAIARMGKIHPLFERAGMTRVIPKDPTRPAYFFLDRFSQRRGK